MGWITPNVQKVAAIVFVFSWFLAQGRFGLFWNAMAGKVVVNQ
jgi:hypothetical protein